MLLLTFCVTNIVSDFLRRHRLEEMKTTQMQYLDALSKYEDQHMGGFRRIYPGPSCDKYDKYFENSCSLFQTTAASKAREEAAKYVNTLTFIFS